MSVIVTVVLGSICSNVTMLSAILLNELMLCVILLNVILLSVTMSSLTPNVAMLSVIMLNVIMNGVGVTLLNYVGRVVVFIKVILISEIMRNVPMLSVVYTKWDYTKSFCVVSSVKPNVVILRVMTSYFSEPIALASIKSVYLIKWISFISVARDLAKLTSPRPTLNGSVGLTRRHSITLCESRRHRKVSTTNSSPASSSGKIVRDNCQD